MAGSSSSPTWTSGANGNPHSTAMTKCFVVLQMLMCVAGIYICFGLWSVKQERLMTQPYFAGRPSARTGWVHAAAERFPSVFGISLCQSLAGAVLAAASLGAQKLWQRHRLGKGLPPRGGRAAVGRQVTHQRTTAPLARADVVLIAIIGFNSSFGTSLGYAAMRYLSFPVVLAAKMSKMMPVILVGYQWYGIRYPLSKVLVCCLITAGVLGFYVLEEAAHPGVARKAAKHSARAGMLGFALLFFNLIMDGFTKSTQDVLVRRRRWSGEQLMFWTNLSSVLWVSALLIALQYSEPLARSLVGKCTASTPQASSMFSFLYPWVMSAPKVGLEWIAFHDFSKLVSFLRVFRDARRDLFVLSLLNAVGQFFIFRAIYLFGTLTLTSMTLVRKTGSVVLSIFIHNHRVNRAQWSALLIILVGVVWEGILNVRQTAGTNTARPEPDSMRHSSGKAESTTAKSAESKKKAPKVVRTAASHS